MSDEVKIRINLVLKGEPAKWLLQWKARGLITSCRDAVIQAFRVFQERIVEQDLKAARLRTLAGGDEVG